MRLNIRLAAIVCNYSQCLQEDTTLKTDLDPAVDELASRFIAAIEAADTAGIAACCTDDVVIWHNFDDREVELGEVVPLLASLADRVPDLHYADIRRCATNDGYVQQHVLRGTAPSGELQLPACLVVEVQAGCITRIDEYLDRGSLDVLKRPR